MPMTAKGIAVKVISCTWKSAQIYGATGVSIRKTTEIVSDGSDGAVYPKVPASVITMQEISVEFQYLDQITAPTPGDTGALAIVCKDGKGGTGPTITAANAMFKGMTGQTGSGAGSLTWECYSTDGATQPIIVS